jgi:hypothetical protein
MIQINLTYLQSWCGRHRAIILFWSKMILVTDFAVTVVQIKKTLTNKSRKYDTVYGLGV